MFSKAPLVLAFIGALSSVSATPLGPDRTGYTFSTLTTVPGTKNLENIAMRSNSDFLVTSTTSNVLHLIPSEDPKAVVSVAEFPALGLIGIAELDKDIFYLIGSNVSGLEVAPGSNRVWRVGLTQFQSSNGAVRRPAHISLVADFPDAGLLNGMTKLDQHHLLLSDSQLGRVVKLDVRNGKYSTFSDDATLAPLSTAEGHLGIGVNGVHVFDRKLYFTSLDQGLFASIDLARPTDPAKIIVKDLVNTDDFALTADGKTAFVANNGAFTLTEVDIPGKTSRLINSTYLETASSAAFSRGPQKVLYVTGAESTSENETIGRVAVGVPKH
ncbi:hypothetical protein PRZ48_013921 [Zasmidium cellare]|uniref:SMP-30/Gluconolactonase/LRE-like region domain-containing protein n=1 Tax=Zasmidium cellare TaxID=395010 RepID=A0ABR0DZG7_ZASCE|nr:hypothetical protein PRZ48_013921 [Zasmidium cellare]